MEDNFYDCIVIELNVLGVWNNIIEKDYDFIDKIIKKLIYLLWLWLFCEGDVIY